MLWAEKHVPLGALKRHAWHALKKIEDACWVELEIRVATPQKVGVATQLREDKRGSPQMPWPLVQPRPTRVPMPTKVAPTRYRAMCSLESFSADLFSPSA